MAFRKLNSIPIKHRMIRLYSMRPEEMEQPRRQMSPPMPLQPPKLTTLPNGLLVSSVENTRPMIYITIAVKAGSRYETPKNQGVSHVIRNCFGLTSKRYTTFGIIRNLQLAGAELEVENTRDFIIYRLVCHRSKLRDAIQYFTSSICEPIFFPWELKTFHDAMRIDIAKYLLNPHMEAMEMIHKAAFRTGLGNSIFSSLDMVGRHDQPMVNNYFRGTFALNRAAVGIVGLSHEFAIETVNLMQFESQSSIPDVAPVYGGGEVRMDKIGPYAHVMIANQSVGVKDHKGFASFATLQHLLGTNPLAKRRCNNTRIFNAVRKSTNEACGVTAINHSYTDAGLFAFYLSGRGEDIGTMIRALFDELNTIKAGVSEADVQQAKQKAKTATLINLEHPADLADDLAFSALQHGKAFDSNYWDSLFESVSTSDVNNAIKRVVNGNLSIGVVGNLINMPFLDEFRQPAAQPQQPPPPDQMPPNQMPPNQMQRGGEAMQKEQLF